jgi:DNA-binding MarR family transcriptional regulator
MVGFSTDASDVNYDGAAPVLLAGSSEAALARAERTIAAAGLRIGAQLSFETALARIDQQGAAAGLWIEIDRDCGAAMDELLGRISRDVADGRYAAVVSSTKDYVDLVTAAIDEPRIEIIVNGSEAERAAAWPLARAHHDVGLALHERASDRSAERLRQLSDEVSRIASTLARLSSGPAFIEQPTSHPVLETGAAQAPPLSIDTVSAVIRARRLRAKYFAEDLFADPAWDMLLDLLQAEIAQLRVPVSSLCIAAAVPATTALRWLKTMVSQSIFIRRPDPHDGRRVYVELAPEASRSLRRYFAEVGPVVTI